MAEPKASGKTQSVSLPVARSIPGAPKGLANGTPGGRPVGIQPTARPAVRFVSNRVHRALVTPRHDIVALPIMQTLGAQESLSPRVDWTPVASSLAEISASNEELEGFLGGVFEDLEGLFGDFLRQQKALQLERQRMEAEMTERQAELERQRAEIAALREGLLADIRAEVNQAVTASVCREGLLEKVVADFQQDRQAFQTALDEARAQWSQAAQTQAEIAELRSELRQWLEQQAKRQAQSADAEPADALKEQIRRLEKEREVMERERATLEAELETVRARAAELAETLDQQKRQVAEERARWTEEIRRFRQIVELMSASRGEKRASGIPSGPPPTSGPGAETAPSGSRLPDAALDSIIAQFELLQKDVARRRKRPPEPTAP